MKCKICDRENDSIFSAKIFNKYIVKYYACPHCGFLQTEEPYWLEEVYSESINVSDTGIMSRNIQLSKLSSVLLYFFYDKNKMFLDFAGGYGIFTRLMRDIGFNFYWNDKYSENLVARGFEYNAKDEIELMTSFESFEHFDNPLIQIEKMLEISNNILFTTMLTSDRVPKPDEWWYFGLEHGQHVSFYNQRTLEFIAKKYELNLYTDGVNVHLLTDKNLNKLLFKSVLKLNRFGLFYYIKRFFKSKTISDMNEIIKRKNP